MTSGTGSRKLLLFTTVHNTKVRGLTLAFT